MQLLFEESSEFGISKGLGLIKGNILPLCENTKLRVPHMGWNEITTQNDKFQDHTGDYYFVHSYYCNPCNKEDVLFETNYGFKFCSGINVKNQIYGFQFHPEKSQSKGLDLLKSIL